MFKKTLLAVAMTALASSVALADAKLANSAQKEGYAMGMILGRQIKSRLDQIPGDYDKGKVIEGIADMIQNAKPALTETEMTAVLKKQQERMQAAAAKKAKAAKAEGAAFLTKWGKEHKAKKTKSGIYYHVLKAGKGKQPKVTDKVKVNYKGTLRTGKEFDSSYKRGKPAEFPVNGVIKGWQEIVPMMKEGGKWEVAIPSDLAYGATGMGGVIGPNEPLVFEIELLEVK